MTIYFPKGDSIQPNGTLEWTVSGLAPSTYTNAEVLGGGGGSFYSDSVGSYGVSWPLSEPV